MDCQLFERQIQRSIDGLLATHEQEDILKHAALCPECAALLQDITAVHNMLKTGLSPVDVPEGFAASVMAALPAPYTKKAKVLAFPAWRWQRFGSVAAAAVLLIAASVYGLLPDNPGVDPAIGPAESHIVATDPGPDNSTLPQLPQKNNTPIETAEEIMPLNEEDPSLLDTEDNTEDQKEEQPTVTQPPSTVTAEVAEEEEPSSYSTSVGLPMPAYNPSTEGVLILNMLAAYDECDAILPSLNSDGAVEFYIRYKGLIHLWTQTLSAEAAPEHQGQVKSLPSLSQITGSVSETATLGYPYVSALSPDERAKAVNRGGDAPGVWLYEDLAALETATEEIGVEISGGVGGGTVLSWSPDGNKLLYTDATGKLFVYYLHMPTPYSLTLYNGIVSCASWADDGTTVLFAGKADKNQHSAIYTIQIP